MTEEDWLAYRAPGPLVRFLLSRASERKLRLIACGLYRARWPAPTDPRCEQAVAAAEAFADGKATLRQMEAAGQAAGAAAVERNADLLYADRSNRPARKAARALLAEVDAAQATTHHHVRDALWRLSALVVKGVSGAGLVACCAAVRDMAGNPWKPVAFNPSWRSSSVLILCQTIYASNRFDLMPVLGDALADAGCDDAEVLNHARGGGGHRRGCWLVDGLLGKE